MPGSASDPILLDKFVRIAGFIGIQRRSDLQRQARLPVEKRQTVFFQLFGQEPDLDSHRADPFTSAAIRTAAGAMIRP